MPLEGDISQNQLLLHGIIDPTVTRTTHFSKVFPIYGSFLASLVHFPC